MGTEKAIWAAQSARKRRTSVIVAAAAMLRLGTNVSFTPPQRPRHPVRRTLARSLHGLYKPPFQVELRSQCTPAF
jgi:hypothetical protein